MGRSNSRGEKQLTGLADVHLAFARQRFALCRQLNCAISSLDGCLSLIHWGDQTTALSALDRALALNPNSAHAWRTKALCQSLRGAAHAVVAVEAGNRAIRLSPLDPLCYVYKFSVALAYLGARQYHDAEVWIDDALREQPRFHASFRVKVSLCGLLGRNEEARDWLVRLLDLQPGLTIAAWAAHAATFLAPETKALMIEGLRKGGLPE